MDELQDKIFNWIEKIWQWMLEHKKLMAGVGIVFLVGAGAAAYVFRDSLAAMATNQKIFLGALFDQKSALQNHGTQNAANVAAAPAKDCPFETSETPAHSPLIINEIAWMGNKESSNNEWIELKNISKDPVALRNWSLVNESEKIKVVIKSGLELSGGDFYLLERGGADFLPNIKADGFFSGAIKNSGDSFRLFDGDCHLVDQVLASSGWPAGDNKTKKTMERSERTLAWHASAVAGGTPKQENYFAAPVVMVAPVPATKIKIPEPSVAVLSSPSPSPMPSQTAPGHLLISQVMVASATSASDAFVEFYNPTTSPISLTGWTIKKKSSTGSQSALLVASRLKGKTVFPGKYFLAANESGYTGAVLSDAVWPGSYLLAGANNAVLLYDAAGALVDEVSWKLIPKGQSYQRSSWASDDFHAQAIPNPRNSQSR